MARKKKSSGPDTLLLLGIGGLAGVLWGIHAHDSTERGKFGPDSPARNEADEVLNTLSPPDMFASKETYTSNPVIRDK
jgi:hypothetical protein